MMLPASVIFDYPTVQALVSYLETELETPADPSDVLYESPVYARHTQLPAVPTTQSPNSAALISPLSFVSFEASLKTTLAAALELDKSLWPASYDVVALGELGFSLEMLAAVQLNLPLQISLAQEDTVELILNRQKSLFTF